MAKKTKEKTREEIFEYAQKGMRKLINDYDKLASENRELSHRLMAVKNKLERIIKTLK